MGGIADGRKGVAQLMRQGGKEDVLALIGFAQRDLGAFAIGVVEADAHAAHRSARLVVQKSAEDSQPAHRTAIGAHDAVFLRIQGLRVASLRERRFHRREGPRDEMRLRHISWVARFRGHPD